MMEKYKKAIISVGSILLLVILVMEYKTINYRIGNYPCDKPYGSLSVSEKIVSAFSSNKFQTEKEMKKEADAKRLKQCNFSDEQLDNMIANPKVYIGMELDASFVVLMDDCERYYTSYDGTYTVKMPHVAMLKLDFKIDKNSEEGKRLIKYAVGRNNTTIRTNNELHVTGKIKSIDLYTIELDESTTTVEITR